MRKAFLTTFAALTALATAPGAQDVSFNSLISDPPGPVTAAPAAAEPVCRSDFAQTKAECAALNSWSPERFSSPETLGQETEFKIVFHSITGYGLHGGGYKDSWTYKLLADPALVKNNPRISASLISERKHATFLGTIGFILEVPEENIVATSHQDLGTSNSNYNQLVSGSESPDWDIVTPERLLEQTPERGYNEIVIVGTSPHLGTSVKVVGVIIDCPADKIVKLNDYSTDQFNESMSGCDLNRRGLEYAIPLLDELRAQYPVYAYSTYYFRR